MGLREDVLRAVAVLAAHPTFSEDEIVEHLVEHGFSPIRAEVLSAFVPLGLGRAVIRRIPADPPVDLCTLVLVRDFAQNRALEVSLFEVPEFVEAQELGNETFTSGVIPREPFQAASLRSAELHALSNLLDQGGSADGARFGPPVMCRLAEAPGFAEWARSFSSARWCDDEPGAAT